MASSEKKLWLPLEANPDVMNQFIWGLGVPEGELEFNDVYGLEDELLDIVPKPVLAVLFLFPYSPQAETEIVADQEHADEAGRKESSDKVYFMKQNVGNACGTICVLHALGNATSEIKFTENSYFDRYFRTTADMNQYERAALVEEDKEIEDAHSVAASSGDTETTSQVEEHYACFTQVDGKLYELDGMKTEPVCHGPSSPDSLLQDAARVIKSRMQKNPESINFNVMALSKKQK